jgi:type VI secretion system protein ImpH
MSPSDKDFLNLNQDDLTQDGILVDGSNEDEDRDTLEPPPRPVEEVSRYAHVRKVLETVPWEFQFFQAVRLLEKLMPDLQSIGRFVTPAREVVRFSATPMMAFPASQVHGLHFPQDGGQPVMAINFMGLTGPLGVMPLYYTELILERLRSKDRTLATFLDLFNHRFVSLFYQAWEKYRLTIAYERGEGNRFSHLLRDLIGLGTPYQERRQLVLDDSLLFYSGLLGMHTHPAASLRQILWDYFDVPVQVEQLVGAWHWLEEPNQCKFDKATTYSEQVGLGAIVGDEIWDQQSGARIRLGPLTLKQYLDFLPTGSAYEPLQALLRFYSGWEIDYEVQLVLRNDQVPGCLLGDESEEGPKLGWVSWAKNQAMNRNPDDTVLLV